MFKPVQCDLWRSPLRWCPVFLFRWLREPSANHRGSLPQWDECFMWHCSLWRKMGSPDLNLCLSTWVMFLAYQVSEVLPAPKKEGRRLVWPGVNFSVPAVPPGVLVGWLTTAWLCWSQMLCGCCDNDSHSVLEYPPESVSGCISEKLHWSGLTNKKLQFWYKEKSGADVTIQRTWFFPPYLLHQSLQVILSSEGKMATSPSASCLN